MPDTLILSLSQWIAFASAVMAGMGPAYYVMWDFKRDLGDRSDKLEERIYDLQSTIDKHISIIDNCPYCTREVGHDRK